MHICHEWTCFSYKAVCCSHISVGLLPFGIHVKECFPSGYHFIIRLLSVEVNSGKFYLNTLYGELFLIKYIHLILYLLCITFFLCICRYEDEPKTPSTPLPVAPGKFSSVSRVDSQDSNATSESDETYKAPVTLDPAPSSSPVLDTNLGNQLTVVRQPLFPDASREVFEQAETSARAVDVNARNRRACFAHTSTQQKKDESSVPKTEAHSTGGCICFTYRKIIIF
jgi:hypothetical protein